MNALPVAVESRRRPSLRGIRAPVVRLAPGLALVGLLVAAGFALNRAVPSLSPLLWAMGLGVLAAPLARSRAAAAPGIRLSARTLLRTGVALLGVRVSLGELAHIGPSGVLLAAGTVTATLGLTTLLGRRLGVPPSLSLLIATGSGICGASAIAAMDTVARAREEHVGYAVATVTVFGSAAMLALPPVAAALGLSHQEAGLWAGASIHEVAQATAAGAVISAGALKLATLVKLTRVVLLAPAVAAVGALSRRSGGERGGARVPGFVLAFLALVALRSLVSLPAGLVDAATTVSTVLLAAALAALGLGVSVGALRAAGLRPLALGLAAWMTAAATALALVLVLPW
jgi:uncharacterized integral membrane protein (TIGR00698 family)